VCCVSIETGVCVFLRFFERLMARAFENRLLVVETKVGLSLESVGAVVVFSFENSFEFSFLLPSLGILEANG